VLLFYFHCLRTLPPLLTTAVSTAKIIIIVMSLLSPPLLVHCLFTMQFVTILIKTVNMCVRKSTFFAYSQSDLSLLTKSGCRPTPNQRTFKKKACRQTCPKRSM